MNVASRIACRLAIVVGWTSALYTIYQLTNRVQWWPPIELPLTALDTAIPFWPWTVIPYFALIGLMYLPAFVADRALFHRSLRALTIAVLINYAIFALIPTTYPRPPLPAGDGLGLSWYRWLTTIDTPVNCFPSGHITAPALGCWVIIREHPSWRVPTAIVFALLALSILTTKQHYVWDLFGGLATAWIGWRLSRPRTS
jgi:hypothetical protein